MRRKASPWQRNLGYPLAMLVLLALTVLSVSFECAFYLKKKYDSRLLRGETIFG